jgi:hypothetical protein
MRILKLKDFVIKFGHVCIFLRLKSSLDFCSFDFMRNHLKGISVNVAKGNQKESKMVTSVNNRSQSYFNKVCLCMT